MIVHLAELALNTPSNLHEMFVDSPKLSAQLCLYLTSPRADFLRGRYVSANWDIPELEAKKARVLAEDLLKLRLTV